MPQRQGPVGQHQGRGRARQGGGGGERVLPLLRPGGHRGQDRGAARGAEEQPGQEEPGADPGLSARPARAVLLQQLRQGWPHGPGHLPHRAAAGRLLRSPGEAGRLREHRPGRGFSLHASGRTAVLFQLQGAQQHGGLRRVPLHPRPGARCLRTAREPGLRGEHPGRRHLLPGGRTGHPGLFRLGARQPPGHDPRVPREHHPGACDDHRAEGHFLLGLRPGRPPGAHRGGGRGDAGTDRRTGHRHRRRLPRGPAAHREVPLPGKGRPLRQDPRRHGGRAPELVAARLPAGTAARAEGRA